MDPVSVGQLASLAGGAGGEAGRQVWTGLTTLVRRPFRRGDDSAGAPGPGEDELVRLQQAPGDGTRAHALSTALAVRAALDPDFATALAAWHEQAKLVHIGDSTVNSWTSGASYYAAELQSGSDDLSPEMAPLLMLTTQDGEYARAEGLDGPAPTTPAASNPAVSDPAGPSPTT